MSKISHNSGGFMWEMNQTFLKWGQLHCTPLWNFDGKNEINVFIRYDMYWVLILSYTVFVRGDQVGILKDM